ncbi:MAG: S-adenosylmethionine:tRNA ribosyltransferase-isomerase, partial [Deltaproteobacteria bacterium]|nr:S-adenosylmethionine:tRNA ribosyltransferase-isomerase [Deltaproteobacteria bacterium]
MRWASEIAARGMWSARHAGEVVDAAPGAELHFPAAEVPRHEVRLVAIERRAAHSVPGARLHRFSDLPRLLRAGDLVVVNDAATLPASLRGVTA